MFKIVAISCNGYRFALCTMEKIVYNVYLVVSKVVYIYDSRISFFCYYLIFSSCPQWAKNVKIVQYVINLLTFFKDSAIFVYGFQTLARH